MDDGLMRSISAGIPNLIDIAVGETTDESEKLWDFHATFDDLDVLFLAIEMIDHAAAEELSGQHHWFLQVDGTPIQSK